MNRVFLDLGFIKIYYYTIFIFFAIISACLLIFKEAKKQNIGKDFLINTIYYVIILGIIGARAYYVLFEWSYYVKNPIRDICCLEWWPCYSWWDNSWFIVYNILLS